MRQTFASRFKKLAALMGSSSEGERHNAVDQAVKLCEENSMSFVAGLETAFGGQSNDGDLQAKLDELQNDNEILANEVRELREQLNATEQQGTGGASAALVKIWSYPQLRLFVLLGLVVVKFIGTGAGLGIEVAPHHWVKTLGAIVFNGALLIAFIDMAEQWIAAEYRKRGAGVVFCKGVIIAGAVAWGVYAFYGSANPLAWPNSTVDPWSAVTNVLLPVPMVLTNIIPWFVGKLSHSNGEPFKTLREWFA